MIITLLGYMGSGKSTIGQHLAKVLEFKFIDLDNYIEEKENLSVSEIFNDKGEIYFRKIEGLYLKEITEAYDNVVLSLGGGTPCYGENIDVINKAEGKSVYLKMSPKSLANRLFLEKDNRPLISHLKSIEELTTFIATHLFERHYYYNQAKDVVNTDDLTVKETLEAIVNKLY